tara:strand:- start:4783 stop:5046 length:264 start_codon:yes stop_codon:yes gene_type:complete
MIKVLNILMLLFVIFFIFAISKFYLSNKNINTKNFNRLNIDEILKEKIKDLPILANDTNNVIQFNNSLEIEINDNKKRSFWDLLKRK